MDNGRYAMEFFKACTGRRSFEGWRQEWIMNQNVTTITTICNIMGVNVTYADLFVGLWDKLSPLGHILVELIKREDQIRHCDFDNDIKVFVRYGKELCGE